MYSESVYARALELKQRAVREKKEAEAAAYEEAVSKCEELALIGLKLKKNGAEAALLTLNGDTEGTEAIMRESVALADRKKELEAEIGLTAQRPECNECNDTGYIGSWLCSCVERIARRLAYSDLAGQAPLEQSTFENFDLNYYPDEKNETGSFPRKRMTAIYGFCRDYAAGFTTASESLLFLGGTGLGKTHLSLAMAGEIIKKGYGVIYGTAQNLFNQMSREHFSYSNDDRMLEEALACDLLIIDDLGTEFSTQFTQSCVYNIVNTRILRGKPTVISSNFTLVELEKIYSPRIMSRIIGSYTMKKFNGSDIRQIKLLKKSKT